MKQIKTHSMMGLILLGLTFHLPSTIVAQNSNPEINDMTTPLHLLKPDYKVPYGELTVEQVKADIDKVFNYIEKQTPYRVLDKDGKEITSYKNLPHGAVLERGAFRIGSYEWGVTYQALLDAAEATGDSRYKDYVINRFNSANYMRKTRKRTLKWNKYSIRVHLMTLEPCVAP